MSPDAERCPECATIQIRGGTPEEQERARCVACREPLPRGAKVCGRCQAPQAWGGRLAVGQATLALLVALISVVGTVAPLLMKLVYQPAPQVLFVRLGDPERETGEIHLLLRNPADEDVIVSGGRLRGLEGLLDRDVALGLAVIEESGPRPVPSLTVPPGKAQAVVLFTSAIDVPGERLALIGPDRGLEPILEPILEVQVVGPHGAEGLVPRSMPRGTLLDFLRTVVVKKNVGAPA